MADEREQQALEDLSRQAWDIALNTAPCERAPFEEVLAAAYRCAGHAPPQFLWVNGLFEAWLMLLMAGPVLGDRRLARRMLARGSNTTSAGPDRYLDQLLVHLRAHVGAAPDEEAVEDLLGNSLLMDLDRMLFGALGEALRPILSRGATAAADEGLRLFAVTAENLRQEIQGGIGRSMEFALGQEIRRLCEPLGGVDARTLLDEGFFISTLAPVPLLYLHQFRNNDAPHAGIARLVLDLCRHGFWFWPGARACLCCERPREISLDSDRLLHAPDRAAAAFRDGGKLYFHHGVPVPEVVVMEPNLLTTAIIDREPNAEVRRVMTEIYGHGRYLSESGAVVIDMDMIDVSREQDLGAMPRALMQDRHGRKWLVGTDGSTRRVYYMRVPDECLTCTQAHSALAGFDEGRIIASS